MEVRPAFRLIFFPSPATNIPTLDSGLINQ